MNKSLANWLNVPLICFNSHKFNLAVSKNLNRQKGILDKINKVMVKLRAPKWQNLDNRRTFNQQNKMAQDNGNGRTIFQNKTVSRYVT